VSTLSPKATLRKGRMEDMVNHGTGWVRLEYLVPARGLIGLRNEFLTETRGTGILHSTFERYEPWYGEITTRPTGSLVADRRGSTASFALMNLQERGQLFVGPGEEVYEGMVIGENARAEDLDVNPASELRSSELKTARAELDRATELRRQWEEYADECAKHRAPVAAAPAANPPLAREEGEHSKTDAPDTDDRTPASGDALDQIRKLGELRDVDHPHLEDPRDPLPVGSIPTHEGGTLRALGRAARSHPTSARGSPDGQARLASGWCPPRITETVLQWGFHRLDAGQHPP
jgi:hypothetical protein